MTAQIAAESNMPPAARRQAEEANRLVRELNAKPGQVPAGTEVQTMPNDQRPGDNVTADRAFSPQAPASTPPAAASPPPPPTVEQRTAPSQDAGYEQRYRTLQGKYDSEMRALREIVATQQSTMDKLIERGPSSVAPAPAVEQSPTEFLKSLGVSEKELEDYGELLPIVARMAQNMIKPTAAKLEAELTRVRAAAGTVANAQVKSARESLFATLDQRIPNWRLVNEDENFLAWLDQVDIFSGSTRRQGLTKAFENLDSARVVAIFEAYVREDSVSRSTSGPTVDRETLIAPGVPRGGAAEAPGGATGRRIWSESEIKDFYSRVRRKAVSTEEYARFSADIASAVSEGRVRPDRPDHHRNS